jgi:hypothetical protein
MRQPVPDLDRLEALFAEREPTVRAFLPEAGRFDRLRREAAALAERWPDPERRPPLFGVLVASRTSSLWTAFRPAPAAAFRRRSWPVHRRRA